MSFASRILGKLAIGTHIPIPYNNDMIVPSQWKLDAITILLPPNSEVVTGD
jgi:hypothetical protein